MKLNCASEGIWRKHCQEKTPNRTKEIKRMIVDGTLYRLFDVMHYSRHLMYVMTI